MRECASRRSRSMSSFRTHRPSLQRTSGWHRESTVSSSIRSQRPFPPNGSTATTAVSTWSICVSGSPSRATSSRRLSRRVSDSPFSYALYRVVPRVERGERINVGVVVFSRPLDYLEVRTHLDEARLAALWPELDPTTVLPHLQALERIAAGDPAAGPIAQLDLTARFHWLVAPSSTIIQPSAVHTGLCGDPAGELEKLFRTIVL